MNNIIIYQLRPGIGDMCVFLSSIYEISKKNPNSKITLITKKNTKAKNFLSDEKYINKIIYIEEIKKKLPSFFSLIFFLKKEKYDKAYIFHYGFKYFLISKILSIKEIYFYGFLKKNESISMRMIKSTCDWLNIENYNTTSVLNYNGNIIEGDKILIGIGSSGLSRKWSTDNFINLIKKINIHKRYKIIILGGPNEKSQAEDIINNFSSIKITSLCNSSVYETFSYIKNSKIYVGTDSGFMHLSSALNVKTFGLFGDTPTNYVEYSDNITPIIPEGYQFISHNSNAMKDFTPEYVYSKILKYLN